MTAAQPCSFPPPQPLMPAKFIWNEPVGAGRNRYVLFRYGFSLVGAKSGVLNIFADTRYRLMVNGRTVGHGPARFFTAQPEYDTYDLGPYLRSGRNVIAAVVNSVGGVTFQSQSSVGALIAWGHARDKTGRTVPIATDETWRTIESPGHRRQTAYVSFALNPGEYLDARQMPPGWTVPEFDDRQWDLAVPARRQEHWGALRPRSIPALDERLVRPRRRLGTWAARRNAEEAVYSLMLTTATGRSLHTLARVAVLTYIHSPRAQRVVLGAWLGRYWLNGRELAGTARTDVAMRRDYVADLEEGWNTLLVYDTMRSDWWDFYLALPKNAELAISAEKEIDSPETFLVGGPWEDALADEADQMPLPLASPSDLPAGLGAWQPWARGDAADTPCRQRAWRTFEKLSDDAALRVDVPSFAKRVGDDTLALLYDFGAEVLGRPILDFTAHRGTTIDLTYSERLRRDGVSDVHGRLYVDMAERYIARSGRQRWHTFHPRGFRYLEVLITGKLAEFALHDVAVTRASYPVESMGRFECSDPGLNEIWELGRGTLEACMEDAYVDCPWRERGVYVGDLLVQFLVNRACFGDTRLFRRCIELIVLSQGDNGLVAPGAHGLPPGRHPDYSALVPQLLWVYWSATGDTEFLGWSWPALKRLMNGLLALRTAASGDLLDGSELEPYLDLSRMDRGGVNCALNCFYQRGFHDAARVAELLGRGEPAAAWARTARQLAGGIRREFWDESRGVFVDRRRADVAATGPSVAANALPLLYDIAGPEQAPRALLWLLEAMRENFGVPEPRGNADCNVTPYFAFYALGALYKSGHAVEAERFIRGNWGRMVDAGAWACWEYFVDEVNGSRCHAWSACPTHYLSSQVLGVSFPEAGNPDRVHIEPHPGTLLWARGTWPHARGPIRVSWRAQGGKLEIEHEAPAGVEISIASG